MRILISFFPLGFFAAEPFGVAPAAVDILQVKMWLKYEWVLSTLLTGN